MKKMSIKCLTDSELEDMIARFDTKGPQDRAVFYALTELKSHRTIRSIANKKPLGECEDSTKGPTKSSVTG